MQRFSLVFLIGLSSLAVACTPAQDSELDDSTQNSSASSSEEISETRNVLYRGMLREAGVSIYMQGTHRLDLDDGRFVLLESDVLDLNDYVDSKVEVFGSVRPTVEAGGLIMRVESIQSLEETSSESSASGSSVSSEEEISSEDFSLNVSSDAVSSAFIRSSAPDVSSVFPQVSSITPWQESDELTAKASAMAKSDMDMGNWTQQYCSTHWKFCIPVHRNWWFKSFGATSSSLWHVEIGPQEMNNLGEGPISVNLVSGSVESANANDGQVIVRGDTVVGFRSLEDGKRFEIRGPAVLEQAIRIITENLRKTAG